MLEEKDYAEPEPRTKSVMDDLSVVNQAFPTFPDYVAGLQPHHPKGCQVLKVVGRCQKCDSPIYGPEEVLDSQPISVRRTCACPADRGSVPMRTT